MAETRVFWVVGTQCLPDTDEEDYNRWYNESHVPLLMANGLVKRTWRMKLSDTVYHEAKTTHTAPRYMAIYEFESGVDLEKWLSDRSAGTRDKLQKWGENGGYEVFWTSRYDVIGAWDHVENGEAPTSK